MTKLDLLPLVPKLLWCAFARVLGTFELSDRSHCYYLYALVLSLALNLHSCDAWFDQYPLGLPTLPCTQGILFLPKFSLAKPQNYPVLYILGQNFEYYALRTFHFIFSRLPSIIADFAPRRRVDFIAKYPINDSAGRWISFYRFSLHWYLANTAMLRVFCVSDWRDQMYRDVA